MTKDNGDAPYVTINNIPLTEFAQVPSSTVKFVAVFLNVLENRFMYCYVNAPIVNDCMFNLYLR